MIRLQHWRRTGNGGTSKKEKLNKEKIEELSSIKQIGRWIKLESIHKV